ncbi:class I SAM-dependent methyltransferase [Pleionea sp. CnH1-48]|uniref:class I SAM-dependent methyltransferase n=1 Tax=Pleionea sp. CnH1-48 TaxID=2954494 RepID=UPI002096FB67|nr:class I SAM-dependent methyltransferase [Pleionea sp. CnH1-48]MCO7226029.1 methyltransferase domain-containing protein [Pleionea sp. CnH1-48]
MTVRFVYISLLAVLSLFSNTLLANNDFITQAVNNPARPESDLKRDSHRKPAQVLSFFKVRPGMTVVDIFSGGGYYTELLSYAVGPKGKVIAHNNQAYEDYVKKMVALRYKDKRLPNVARVIAEANELVLPNNSADMMFMVLAYHDIYYRPKDGNWPTIERDDFLQRMYQSLKPGGTLAVIDHKAAPGSPRSTGHTLHRIDPAIVIKELNKIGFKLVDESDILANPKDDHQRHMYAPGLRGQTDRFVLKFIKPLTLDNQLANETPFP